MNRSGIEWCDHTWNPITGCRHGCPYCYSRAITRRFSGDIRLNFMATADYLLEDAADGGEKVYVLEKPMLNETGKILNYPFGFEPTFHHYRIEILDNLKMGCNIFVGAMADVFGAWVPDKWICEILDACMERPIHNYLFLTKNPRRYLQYGVPTSQENIWYGTTITSQNDMDKFQYLPASSNTFISIEPLLEDLESYKNNAMYKQADWIIIGAETGRRKDRIVPKKEWIEDILYLCDKENIPVFMKDSLIPIIGEEQMRRDFPSALLTKKISPKMEKKLYGKCASCKLKMPKNNMIALLARSKRGEQPKQFGYMCKDCFRKFCKDLGLDMPLLAELAESVTFEAGEDKSNE